MAKRILKLSLLLGTVISLWFVPWIVVKAWIVPLPATIQEQANEAVENGFQGIIIYIDQANQAPAFCTAGWHNKDEQIPARPNALFKIASISKLYTAVALTKMSNQGLLNIDSTLSYYLPELAQRIAYADKITLKMLAKHRSGIPNYTNSANYWEHPKESYQGKLDLILDLPADFAPDEDYAYSNTNYLLLAKIMDNVLGRPHFEYIQETVLTRLNLKNTFRSIAEVNMEDVMSGYHIGHPFDLKTDDIGMVASAKDVGTFLRALNDGSLFDGNEEEIYSTLYTYDHKGWVPGYQSIAKYNPELDAVVVQFTNTTDPKLYYWNLADVEFDRVIKILEQQHKQALAKTK